MNEIIESLHALNDLGLDPLRQSLRKSRTDLNPSGRKLRLRSNDILANHHLLAVIHVNKG